MPTEKEIERQIFVRNLAFDVTEADLVSTFEEFGPLKNCTVVQKNGVSKGFGFVKFALEEDAKTALKARQNYSLKGRNIKLEIAIKADKAGKSNKQELQPLPVKPQSSDAAGGNIEVVVRPKKQKLEKSETQGKAVEHSGHDASGAQSVKRARQLLVLGVPADITKKAFFLATSKIARKGLDVELIKEEHELAKDLRIVNPPGRIMLITVASKNDAKALSDVLTAGTVESLNIRKYLKKEKESKDAIPIDEENGAMNQKKKNKNKEKLVVRSMTDLTDAEHQKKKCRVILRNLSFEATEQNVIDKMDRFGPIVGVEIPRVPVERKGPALPRRKGGKQQQQLVDVEVEERTVLRPRGFGFVTFLCERDAALAVKESAEKTLKICNREVAVDSCMNKETFLKYGVTDSVEEQENNATSGVGGMEKKKEKEELKEENEEKEDHQTDEEDEEEAEEIKDEEEEDEEEEEEREEEEEEEDEKATTANTQKASASEDVHDGLTVFIRGLPFDAEPKDLRQVMRIFGPIESALVVKDKLTGISKGSAFVKFADKGCVERCLKAAASSSAGGLIIKDRACRVDLAVDREKAQVLKLEDKIGKDKRNLYLANEGLVVVGEAARLSEADAEKRKRAQLEKRKKLQNPLFFVSANRLSIRNLRKTVTDKDLKITCLKALKAALSNHLVQKKDVEAHILAQGRSRVDDGDAKEMVPAFTPRSLKSAKVMFDASRVRGDVPQSRGYGFVEFESHAHALACLRELNNNAKYSALSAEGGKLIVEFSVENIQKVKILEERKARLEAQRAASKEFQAMTAKSSLSDDVLGKGKKRPQQQGEDGDAEKAVKKAKVNDVDRTKLGGKKDLKSRPLESDKVELQNDLQAPKRMKREDQSKESKLSQTLSNVLHDEKVPEEPKVDKQKKKKMNRKPQKRMKVKMQQASTREQSSKPPPDAGSGVVEVLDNRKESKEKKAGKSALLKKG